MELSFGDRSVVTVEGGWTRHSHSASGSAWPSSSILHGRHDLRDIAARPSKVGMLSRPAGVCHRDAGQIAAGIGVSQGIVVDILAADDAALVAQSKTSTALVLPSVKVT